MWLQPYATCGCGRRAAVVRLEAADGDDRVAALGLGVGQQELELANLNVGLGSLLESYSSTCYEELPWATAPVPSARLAHQEPELSHLVS